MKKIACAALALTLLGSTAAQAHGWHGGGWHGGHGWHHGWGGGAALGVGLGFLALGVIAAESAHDDAVDRDRYYRERDGDDRDGPPPPPRGEAYRDGPPDRDGAYRDAPPPGRDGYRDDRRGGDDGYRDEDRGGNDDGDRAPDRAPHPLHNDDGDDN